MRSTGSDVSDYGRERLGDVLDAIASDAPAPGGGAAAALTVALAAALAGMVARRSGRAMPDAAMLAADADRLRSRVEPLAAADAAAYSVLLDALRRARDTHGQDAPAAEDLQAAFEVATDVPLEVAGLGAEVAALAGRLAVDGNANLHGDAATGALLAEAATRSAATLVRLNVEHGGLAADRAERARARVEQAARSASVVRPDRAQP